MVPLEVNLDPKKLSVLVILSSDKLSPAPSDAPGMSALALKADNAERQHRRPLSATSGLVAAFCQQRSFRSLNHRCGIESSGRGLGIGV